MRLCSGRPAEVMLARRGRARAAGGRRRGRAREARGGAARQRRRGLGRVLDHGAPDQGWEGLGSKVSRQKCDQHPQSAAESQEHSSKRPQLLSIDE